MRKEPRSPGSHSIPNGNFRAFVTQSGGPDQPVSIRYFDFLVGRPGLGWRPTADSAATVLVSEGTDAPNLREGKAIAREILRKLATGEIVAPRGTFVAPPMPDRVVELEHPTDPLKAIVLRWPTEYEVRTMGYVRDGFTLPVSTPSVSNDKEYGWGWLDPFERLLADTEAEAIRLAQDELDRLSREPIPFKRRDAKP